MNKRLTFYNVGLLAVLLFLSSNTIWAGEIPTVVLPEKEFTVFKTEVAELGFKGDYTITEWSNGTSIDEPDGSVSIWKRVDNPAKPTCYKKNSLIKLFAKFAITPALSEPVNNVKVRVKLGEKVFAEIDGVTLSGSLINIDDITATIPLESIVKTTELTFTWEISFDAGATWLSAGTSGPHTIYWTYDAPLLTSQEKLYDLSLEKACGYVNGSTDIAAKINTGIDGEIRYNPSRNVSEPILKVYSPEETEGAHCGNHAKLMEYLLHSIGKSASVINIWGGCSASVIDFYRYGSWWGPSFRVLKSAHDEAEENPHFTFHAEVLTDDVYYDPSYGTTGLITLDETAPAHLVGLLWYPAAQRQIGNLQDTETHYVDWTCPH